MEPFEINSEFATLADDALVEYQTSVRAHIEAIVALGAEATDEQVTEAETLAGHLDEIAAEADTRSQAEETLASRRQALADRFSTDTPEDEPEPEPEPAPEPEGDQPQAELVDREPEPEAAPVAASSTAAATATKARSTVTAVASRTSRPAPPARAQRRPVTITASANTMYSVGDDLGDDLSMVTEAALDKMKAFTVPDGDGTTEDLHKYPLAKFALDFDEDLVSDKRGDDLEVLYRAKDETRLPDGSLVAAAGWCAPSETLYDLCSTESTDGIGSVPEIAVRRGGIKYTSGPDYSAIFGASGYFDFTEAQSIAGTGQSVNKPCMTVPCPTFTDTRLDSVGLCVKVEFLANEAYPELTQRFVSGALIAQQHKVWVKVLNKMLALATAKTWLAGAGSPDGSVAADTFDGLALYGAQLRQKYRLPLTTSLEVLVPVFLKEVIRSDISRRTGQPFQQVSDGDITGWFSARQMNVQFVYGLPAGTATGGVDLALADVTGPPAQDSDTWPTTFQALMYPAGTFVKGVADVVNLSAVYDAASLANNVYTGLFVEQGVLVAQLCPEAFKVTLPVCAAGRTGIADLSCA